MKALCSKKNEQGFTLIEIIAVLLLLGFLAAVIVPQYNRLIADAKNKAMNAALAEGVARVNAAAASYILTGGGTAPSLYTQLNTSMLSTYAGDYRLSFSSATSSSVQVSAVGVGPNVTGSTGGTTVTLPQ